jgi:short-chain fatty acids transporter
LLGGVDFHGCLVAQLGPVAGVRRLLVRALARRTDLRMDYRAAGAAAYLGLGAVWALGLSSSAAQLQANPASLPPSILSITGVIRSPRPSSSGSPACVAGAGRGVADHRLRHRTRPEQHADAKACGSTRFNRPNCHHVPGEWLEHSPLLTICWCCWPPAGCSRVLDQTGDQRDFRA